MPGAVMVFQDALAFTIKKKRPSCVNEPLHKESKK